MAPAAGMEAVDLGTEWWTRPEYRDGRLELPGQSRLEGPDRALLEDVARSVNDGLLEIPSMPKATSEALRMTTMRDVDVGELGACIEHDLVMCAHILRHANSALYGVRHPIDTPARAVLHLGLRRIKNLVLEAAMRHMANEIRARSWAEMEWSFSLHCAAIARRLGRRFHHDEDLCYTSGLLHDIGRLPILKALELRGRLDRNPEPDSAPEIILECLHRGVGGQVARAWGLPPAVADAVTSHLTGRLPDEPCDSQYPSTRVCEAAGDLCLALGLGRFRRPFAVLSSPSLLGLGFTTEGLEGWLREELPGIVEEVAAIV